MAPVCALAEVAETSSIAPKKVEPITKNRNDGRSKCENFKVSSKQ
jgi:hypothetical protein